METKTILWNEKEEAVAALKRGEIVLFPTETVYGIACLASSEKAFERLCEIIPSAAAFCEDYASLAKILC